MLYLFHIKDRTQGYKSFYFKLVMFLRGYVECKRTKKRFLSKFAKLILEFLNFF